VLGLLTILVPGLFTILTAIAQSPTSPKMLTGTHFPDNGDFKTLKALGYDFAVITLRSDDVASWKPTMDAAQSAGIKLIVGASPPPYVQNGAGWTITDSGTAFLSYLQTRADVVIAVYVFNEPYSSNPYAGGDVPCGFFSAGDLRALRSTIQAFWPRAKIYQDLGGPSQWAPGGSHAASHPCVGNKYANQMGVADYVGIWAYPFTIHGYDRNGALSFLRREASFILNSMQPAQPISLNQAYACASCDPGFVFPTAEQMLDWNCTTRSLPFAAVDWYPWRKFSSYTQALVDMPAYWPVTTAEACAPGMGAGAIGLSAASGIPFVAANSLVSIYGANFASRTLSAKSQLLPTSLGDVTLQVREATGAAQKAPLLFVSPGQINFLMPAGISSSQVALMLTNGGRSPLAGTALVRAIAPALFTADASGRGVAAATAIRVESNNQQTPVPVFNCSGATCTSVPIDLGADGSVYLNLYGTGIRNHTGAVTCSINHISVPVLYAGAQGQYEGLDQVKVGPLAHLSGSGEVDLVLTVDGQSSNPVLVNFR
jgi:uncharacterized protein (TIGR03437 family)